MRRFALLGLAVLAVTKAALGFDFYSGKKLVPGADGGTTAFLSLSDAGLGPGVQFMVRSTDPITYRACQFATVTGCVPTSDDSVIDANQSLDLCGVSGLDGFAVWRTNDGGSGTVRLYRVSPQSKGCQP